MLLWGVCNIDQAEKAKSCMSDVHKGKNVLFGENIYWSGTLMQISIYVFWFSPTQK